ncbi:hypothetical protein ANN_27970 [Periplaneta americana]|uniref:Uncharacterized protein n=1 Tax=Periplaneta americana TaxID=6978 RepID=A0ABQ8RUX7_PERAM|nr:hypothetical protein ANN_27970 [Periplaneta americana]
MTDKCAIRRTFLEYYEQHREIPTLKKLLFAIKDSIQFRGSNTTLWRLVKEMGFRFKKCKNFWSVLMERKDIVARRVAYLRAVRKNERGKINL